MAGSGQARAAAFAGLIVLGIVGTLALASYLFVVLAGLPQSLGLPPFTNAAGVVLMVVGLVVAAWVSKYRRPTLMAASTYVTLMKLFGRLPLAERLGREEPLVVAGPQKYVRNPLYFAVVLLALGLGLGGGFTLGLVFALGALILFRLVIIPFEEKELRVIFRDEYVRYEEEVPMLVPFTKIRKKRGRL